MSSGTSEVMRRVTRRLTRLLLPSPGSLCGDSSGDLVKAPDLSPPSALIKPISDEMEPISPTSQAGNRPAQRKPGGIQ
ncbi:hypothetical protein EYF80_041873 [Liparis tanakae]|uniref:Uncharacterized protein n=1 Tax=Liparis tanakae TaxID=230148 RepID=A0A4Z2G410_9TELE|nr:hypothetical protein EYF80_041873 [Liparis tanakae]